MRWFEYGGTYGFSNPRYGRKVAKAKKIRGASF